MDVQPSVMIHDEDGTELIEEVMDLIIVPIRSLCKIAGVSLTAMAIRIEELSLIQAT